MASTKASSVPIGLKEQLDKLMRIVLLNRPVELYKFFAEYLEAELDRRTLHDLQMGKHTIRRDECDSATGGRDAEMMSKTKTCTEAEVSTGAIRRAPRKKESTPKQSVDKPRQKRLTKVARPLASDASTEKGAKQVPDATSLPSKASGDSKTPRTNRKSTEDTDRKPRRAPNRKSKEDSKKDDKDAGYFEDYFLSQEPEVVPESFPSDDPSGTKIGKTTEQPEVVALYGSKSNVEERLNEDFPIFQGFEGQVSAATDLKQEAPMNEDFPVFQGSEVQESSGTNSNQEPPKKDHIPVFQGVQVSAGTDSKQEPPMNEDIPVFQGFEGQESAGSNSKQEPPMTEDFPVFQGFEGQDSIGMDSKQKPPANEDLPVFQGFEGQESAGKNSEPEPPMFPDFDRQPPAGTDKKSDEKQSVEIVQGGEEFREGDGFQQEQESTELVRVPESPGGRSTGTGEEIMTAMLENITAGTPQDVTEPSGTSSGPDEVTETTENLDAAELTDLGLLMEKRQKDSMEDDFNRAPSPMTSTGVEDVLHPVQAMAAEAEEKEETEEEEEEEKERDKEKTDVSSPPASPQLVISEPPTDDTEKDKEKEKKEKKKENEKVEKEKEKEEEEDDDDDADEELVELKIGEEEGKDGEEGDRPPSTSSKPKEGLLTPTDDKTKKKKKKDSTEEEAGSETSFVRILPSIEDLMTPNPVSSFLMMSDESFPFLHAPSDHKGAQQPVAISTTTAPPPPSPTPQPPPPPPAQQQPQTQDPTQQPSRGPGGGGAPPKVNAAPANTPAVPGQMISIDGLLEQVRVIENTMQGPQSLGTEQS